MNIPDIFTSPTFSGLTIMGLYAIQVLNIYRIKKLEEQVEKILKLLYRPVVGKEKDK